jgi:hypothetical protein
VSGHSLIWVAGQVSGTDYKADVVSKLCAIEWSKSFAFNLINVLREIPVSTEQGQQVVSKITK